MTTPPIPPGPVPPPGCPAHTAGTPIHGPEFTARRHPGYARLRAEHGGIAPVTLAPGITAHLVLDYDTALRVLRDDHRFAKNPSRWQAGLPAGSPVGPMMFYRRNALFSDGPDHDRYRSAITESLARVDPHALRQHTQDSADELIHRVAPTGRAELVRDYAGALPLLTINRLLGANPADGPALVQIMAKLFNGDGDAAAANEDLSQYMARLITAKRARPGPDVTSWLTAHPARLQDTELAQQIALLMAAGTEPLQNLIANTLVLLLSDDRFAGGLAAGTLPVDDALDEVLWALPPLANFGTRYPRTTVTVAGTVLPANQPVLISFEAANRDPRLGEDRSGSRAHLAFSAGSHECPAQRTARGIAAVATERLLDKLPDLALAVPATRLAYTTGPFQYSLTALPVTFPSHPAPPAAPFGGSAWTAPSTASFSTRPEPTSTARPPASGRRARPSRWNCLAAFRRGR